MDLRLTEALMSLEEKLSCLKEEVREIRMHICALEESNEELRALLYSLEGRRESLGQLGKLYGEGFHVCPPHFAQARDGEDCLFCLDFMQRGKAAAGDREKE